MLGPFDPIVTCSKRKSLTELHLILREWIEIHAHLASSHSTLFEPKSHGNSYSSRFHVSPDHPNYLYNFGSTSILRDIIHPKKPSWEFPRSPLGPCTLSTHRPLTHTERPLPAMPCFLRGISSLHRPLSSICLSIPTLSDRERGRTGVGSGKKES